MCIEYAGKSASAPHLGSDLSNCTPSTGTLNNMGLDKIIEIPEQKNELKKLPVSVGRQTVCNIINTGTLALLFCNLMK